MHGYRAVAAGDAKTALGLVRDLGESLDLVVTDVVMPEMDGIEFAEEVEILFPNLNVLYITAYPPSGGELDLDTLVKPFAPDELIERVEKVLRHG